MSMVCPQCKQTFEQQLDCPTCGVRLGYQLGAFRPEAAPPPTPLPGGERDAWHDAAWSRIAAGLLLAQGLAYGSQHLCTAGFLASDVTQNSIWATLWGLVLLHTLQGLSLLIGAGLAGAGQRQGILYGGLIGLLHGLIFLFVQRQWNENLSLVAVCGQPILFLAVGVLGGRLGMMIWTPSPVLALPRVGECEGGFSWNMFSPARYFEGPVSFGRVAAGTMIVVICVIWSNLILSVIVKVAGNCPPATYMQDRLLLFEISALGTLVGAGVAGATTRNGLKQGMCVGIVSSVILVGVQLGSPKAMLEATMIMILSTFFLSLAGGWFGGELFPPIIERRRRSSYDLAAGRW